MSTHRLLIDGLGSDGRRFLSLLREKGECIEGRFGKRLLITGVADSSGTLFDSQGVDLGAILDCKEKGGLLSEIPGAVEGQTMACLVKHHGADLLVETFPSNLWNGQPAWDACQAALKFGMPVVTCALGPLITNWDDLVDLSDFSFSEKPALRFSAALGASFPGLALGPHDWAGCHVQRLEGLFDLGASFCIQEMEKGHSLEEIEMELKTLGPGLEERVLEPHGWGGAAKLCLFANAVLSQSTRLTEIYIESLRQIDGGSLKEMREAGYRTVMMATAIWNGEYHALRVAPKVIETSHPFYYLNAQASGLLLETDLYGIQVLLNQNEGPLGIASALLKDVLGLLMPDH